jgi:hypothetical protein
MGRCVAHLEVSLPSSNIHLENREERVGSWRNFAATSGKKKKKTKVAILG